MFLLVCAASLKEVSVYLLGILVFGIVDQVLKRSHIKIDANFKQIVTNTLTNANQTGLGFSFSFTLTANNVEHIERT